MNSSQQFPLAQVRPHLGAPALFLNDKPVFPLILMTEASALEEWKIIQPCSVHLLTDTFSPGWMGIETYDFSEFDAKMRKFIAADSRAMLMPRIQIDAPADWMDAHPDEVVGYADAKAWDGDTSWGGARHPSFASALWRKDAGESLRRLIRHAAESDYAGNIFGWHLGSGIYGEWHAWNAVYYPDTSPVFAAAYRDWLAQKSPDSLARIPTIEDRRHADLGLFRDPATSRWQVTHAEFFHEIGDRALGEFAAVVKEESANRSLVIAFNGYLPDLDVNQEIDHRAFDQTLRNAALDCFASPHSYTRRKPGEDATMRGFMGSVRAMGKLWLDEADERTSLARPSQWKHVETIEETVEVLWRSFAHALTHNCGLWFMDQGAMWEGKTWYQDKAILESFAEMQILGEKSMSRPRTRASQIAVVASFTNAFHIADRSSGLDHVTNTLINPQLEQWTKCGAPFDLYLVSELFEPQIPSYDVYAFLDTFFLSDADFIKIKQLRDSGKTLIFFYAAGFLSENSQSLERMRDLLSMEIELCDSVTLPDGREQKPGFTVREMNGAFARSGNVYFCPAPPLPATEIRQILKNANVHSYLDSPDPLMVGGGYLAIHAAGAGEKHLRNPLPVSWTNARSGEVLARNTKELTVEMAHGETLILSLDEPQN